MVLSLRDSWSNFLNLMVLDLLGYLNSCSLNLGFAVCCFRSSTAKTPGCLHMASSLPRSGSLDNGILTNKVREVFLTYLRLRNRFFY